jgi:hypothetical protein
MMYDLCMVNETCMDMAGVSDRSLTYSRYPLWTLSVLDVGLRP